MKHCFLFVVLIGFIVPLPASVHKEEITYAKALFYKARYDSIIQILDSLIPELKEQEDDENLAEAFNILGSVYEKSKDFEASKENFDRSGFYFNKIKNYKGLLKVKVNQTNLILRKKQYKKAKEQYLEILDKYLDSLPGNGVNIVYNNLAQSYKHLGIYDSSILYYRKSLKNMDTLSYAEGFGFIKLGIARLHYIANNFDSCLLVLEEVEPYVNARNLREHQKEVFYEKAKVYKEIGDFESALKYARKFSAITDSLHEINKNKLFVELNEKYKSQQKKLELELLKKAQKDFAINAAKNKRYVAIIIVLLIVVILFVIAGIVVTKRRHAVERELANISSLKTKRMISLKEIALRNKEKTLSFSNMEVVKFNEILANIEAYLNAKKRTITVDQAKESIDQIVKVIRESDGADEQWEAFKLSFEEVHPKFFQLLKSDYPNLTSSEERLCAYICLDMKNKEMASLYRISPDSITRKKNRLRVKMGIDSNAELKEKLQKYD